MLNSDNAIAIMTVPFTNIIVYNTRNRVTLIDESS